MTQVIKPTDVLIQAKEHFARQNAYGLKFESECLFAKQIITSNRYIFNAAQKAPDSLRAAILNVAAIGISLNPASAHAYLVPRGDKICLDISYRGLVKLATDSGAIEWAKAVLVYDGDTFRWKGPAKAPEHEADVFAEDRIDAADPLKNLKGGYCLAKLATGEYMVDVMTAGEILEVRDSSKAKDGPWKGKWAGEMAKKTLVKRASKSWPQSAGRDRMDTAVHVLNQHEGFEEEETVDHDKITEFLNLVATGTDMDVLHFMASASDQLQAECYNAAPKGEKMKFKERVTGMMRRARDHVSECAASIRELCEAGDPSHYQTPITASCNH